MDSRLAHNIKMTKDCYITFTVFVCMHSTCRIINLCLLIDNGSFQHIYFSQLLWNAVEKGLGAIQLWQQKLIWGPVCKVLNSRPTGCKCDPGSQDCLSKEGRALQSYLVLAA